MAHRGPQAAQAKRFETTGAAALHTLPFSFNPGDVTGTQGIGLAFAAYKFNGSQRNVGLDSPWHGYFPSYILLFEFAKLKVQMESVSCPSVWIRAAQSYGDEIYEDT